MIWRFGAQFEINSAFVPWLKLDFLNAERIDVKKEIWQTFFSL